MLKRLIFAIAVSLTIVACGRNPMVGDWTASGPMGSATITFKADKSFDEKMGNVTFASGTYEVNGNDVKLTPTKVGGTSIPGVSDQAATGTLSSDGKQLTMEGVSFTKQ